MLVQKRRNKAAPLKLLRKLLKGQGIRSERIVTDGLSSSCSAVRALGLTRRHRPGRLRENNRAQCSHQPLRQRERVMQHFKSQGSVQLFASNHAAFYNLFNVQRHLLSRSSFRLVRREAMSTGTAATAA